MKNIILMEWDMQQKVLRVAHIAKAILKKQYNVSVAVNGFWKMTLKKEFVRSVQKTKLNRFWFVFLLVVSITIIPLAFALGDAERGYDALGGEVFTLALPFLVLMWKECTMEQTNKNRKTKKLKFAKD